MAHLFDCGRLFLTESNNLQFKNVCGSCAWRRLCCSSQPVTARLVARQWKAQARALFLGGRKGGKRGREGGGRKKLPGGALVPAWGPGPGGATTVGPLLEVAFPHPTPPLSLVHSWRRPLGQSWRLRSRVGAMQAPAAPVKPSEVCEMLVRTHSRSQIVDGPHWDTLLKEGQVQTFQESCRSTAKRALRIAPGGAVPGARWTGSFFFGWGRLSSLTLWEGKQKPLVLHRGLAVSCVLTVLGSPVFSHWLSPNCPREAVWAWAHL